MNEQSPIAPHSTLHPPRLWHWAVAMALLLALFFQLTRAALRNSVTFDEGQHISRGYAYLKTGDLRFQRFKSAHPPGMAILEAAPLLLLPNMPEPSTLAGWTEPDTLIFAKQLVWKSPDIEKLLFAARVPVMLVAMLLAAYVFRWASDLGRAGPLAGIVALALCAFDPSIIAHGMLATTDLGVTAFSFIALYWLWKSLRRPSPGVLIAAGVTLGLALMSKMTAVILLPVSVLLIFAPGMATRARTPIIERMTARMRNPRLRRWLGLAVMAAAIYAIAFLTMWAIYRFEVAKLPGVPIPLPAATHLTSVLKAQNHLDVGHPTFLMGQVSEKGWWYYFPVAFLIKTPIPVLILLALSAALGIRRQIVAGGRRAEVGSRRVEVGGRRAAILLLIAFISTYALVALFSAVEIGYRHLLPLFPCLFVLAAQILNLEPATHHASRITYHASRITFYVLLAWHIIGTASVFPDYLTFFNETIGGPRNGWKYLVDSNLDWGQSLIELRTYIAENHLGRINLSATGFVNPAVYGIEYDPLPPMPNPQSVIHFAPKPGRYYIGAHNLQIGSPIDHDVFGWFREREPNEWIANAILVYDVPQRAPGQWVAQCATPQAPLESDVVAEGFGRDDLRLIYFDCRSSWVIPARMPGWYIVGAGTTPAAAYGQLSREFRPGGLSQGLRFTVYRLAALPDFSGILRPGGVAPGAQVNIGPLTFLGFTLDRTQVAPGQAVTLTTYWRVTSGVGRPASIMAHVVAADGREIANGDGLGVPVENWQPGDTIAQRHRLVISSDAPGGQYQLLAGAYWLDTLERWPVLSDDASGADTLAISPIMVRSLP